ncbi:hypothetical protein [Succinivibrio dextrinosolvens]|uniref:hypothetical protein n=1 Tax=Succinivibrio dextrinosolvens TaxID=83771 RepID=UPI001922924E|nr:hypothetical protein [Succinivibrio dextrinosolvens]
MGIKITDEMREYAHRESEKRESHIHHHFRVSHLSNDGTNFIGFLGEFACCEMLGIDWKLNIRENYEKIDSGDIKIGKYVIDVKTETIPQPYFDMVINNKIDDDEKYGRRLIFEKQFSLLSKYDYVLFGGFVRDYYSTWYPLGYISTDYILQHYQPTKKTPFGGEYPSPAAPVKTSELGRIKKFIELLSDEK